MNSQYDYDVFTVKKYNDDFSQIVYHSALRSPGFEDTRKYKSKCSVNDEKLDNNICRAKSRVRELALCNDWDFWCTFTISPEKFDRYNLKTYFKSFTMFLRNYSRGCDDTKKVKYLFIPEMCKDGAWHLHGFIRGIKEKDLFTNQNGYLDWKQYAERFGYISMAEIGDKNKCVSYMMKYMSKDIAKNVTDLGAHLYYASQGLNTAFIEYKGHGCLHAEWDWTHPDGYIKVKNVDTAKQDISEIFQVL